MNRRDLALLAAATALAWVYQPRVGTHARHSLSAGTSKEKLTQKIKIMDLERLINGGKKIIYLYIFKKIMKYTQT